MTHRRRRVAEVHARGKSQRIRVGQALHRLGERIRERIRIRVVRLIERAGGHPHPVERDDEIRAPQSGGGQPRGEPLRTGERVAEKKGEWIRTLHADQDAERGHLAEPPTRKWWTPDPEAALCRTTVLAVGSRRSSAGAGAVGRSVVSYCGFAGSYPANCDQ